VQKCTTLEGFYRIFLCFREICWIRKKNVHFRAIIFFSEHKTIVVHLCYLRLNLRHPKITLSDRELPQRTDQSGSRRPTETGRLWLSWTGPRWPTRTGFTGPTRISLAGPTRTDEDRSYMTDKDRSYRTDKTGLTGLTRTGLTGPTRTRDHGGPTETDL
jgi:hypothetical protein